MSHALLSMFHKKDSKSKGNSKMMALVAGTTILPTKATN